MGYTHLTDISIPISPLAYIKSAGTWTPTFDSNIVYDTRTAAAASFKLFIPVPLLGSSTLTQGSKLVKIDYNYSITTAACTAFTVKLVKQKLNPTGGFTASLVPTTLDSNHDTAAKCYAADDHHLTCFVTTPVFPAANEVYHLCIEVTAAATSVYNNLGAIAYFTLRL